MSICVSQVSLYYQDQSAAVRFWTEKMGWQITTDQPYGEARWIEAEAPEGGTRIVIYPASPEWPNLTGKLNYLLFDTEDIVKAHEGLAARGVEFTLEPKQESWGWSAVFKDDEGHLFHLSQR